MQSLRMFLVLMLVPRSEVGHSFSLSFTWHCRENLNSSGMRKLMNQALQKHNIRVYLMLAEAKCAALRRSFGQQRRGGNTCVSFEVSCLLPFLSSAVLSIPIF